jgi:hypothetical protein
MGSGFDAGFGSTFTTIGPAFFVSFVMRMVRTSVEKQSNR